MAGKEKSAKKKKKATQKRKNKKKGKRLFFLNLNLKIGATTLLTRGQSRWQVDLSKYPEIAKKKSENLKHKGGFFCFLLIFRFYCDNLPL